MARKRNAALAFALSAALALGTIPAPALAEMAAEPMSEESSASPVKPKENVATASGGSVAAEGELGTDNATSTAPAGSKVDAGLAAPEEAAGEAPLANDGGEVGMAPEAGVAALVAESEAADDGVLLSAQTVAQMRSEAQKISSTTTSTGVVKSDGTLWMWGQNSQGQLGDGTTETHRSPVKVLDGVTSVSLAGFDESILYEDSYSAAVKSDGSLWMWGKSNRLIRVGDPNNFNTNQPRPYKCMEDVASVSLGTYCGAVIKTDGSLWMWGANLYQQLYGNELDYTSWYTPQKVMDDVVSVSVSTYHVAAVKTDGSLWVWGDSTFGNSVSGLNYSTPVKIMDNVVSACTQGSNFVAVKSDGSLWTWGKNFGGQLGDGTTTDRSTPAKVMSGVVSAAVRNGGAAAIKTDGSLWMWGANSRGCLGFGPTDQHYVENDAVEPHPTPRKLMDGGVVSVALGSRNSFAVKTDGSVWGWGDNGESVTVRGGTLTSRAVLGDGSATNRYQPTWILGGASIEDAEASWAAVYDPDWYAAKNPDVAQWATDANGSLNRSKLLQHFLSNGKKEGRASRQGFELASYYNANPDLRRAFGTDWARYYDHYRSSGQRENRTATGVGALRGAVTSRDGVDWSPVYDGAYYAQRNPDVANWATRRFASGSVVDDAALLQHFANSGTRECRSGRAGFDVRSYYNANPDLRMAFGGSADWTRYYRHYATNGSKEGRKCTGADQLQGTVTKLNGTDWSPVYDRAYYGQRNPDIVTWATRKCGSTTVLDDYAMLSHFANNGRKEGRASKQSFELASYYNANADLRRAFGTDWARYYDHYRGNGQREGRRCAGVGQLQGAPTMAESVNWAPVYDVNYYAQRNADVASWATRRFASGSVLDDAALLSHFVGNGTREARASKAGFDVRAYKSKNADLARAFGFDWKSYYRHYAKFGVNEHRACT